MGEATRSSQASIAAWAATLGYAAFLLSAFRWLGLLPAPLAVVPVLLAGFRYELRGSLAMALGLSGLHALLAALADLPTAGWLQVFGNGVVLLLVGFWVGRAARDARTRAERAERELAEALQREGDGPWEWDLETQQIRYSEACRTLLGEATSAKSLAPELWFTRVHPNDLPRLREAIDAHVGGRSERVECLHRLRRKDGSWRWVLARAQLVHGPQGRRLSGWLTDLTEQRRSEELPLHHAFHDPLTGLPNRNLLTDRLTHALARARRDPNRHFAVMYVDVEGLEKVNTELGLSAGDELLSAIAQRLESSVRPGDSVARVGSSAFAVLLEDADAGSDALSVGERVRRALLTPVPVGGRDLVNGANIGLVLGDGTLLQPEELLRRAREAAREAKESAGARAVLFDPQVRDRALERASMERALRDAIEQGQMAVHYQPIIDLRTGGITGFEALARWRHPTLGLIAPMTFIPLAEETGLISELGAWVLFESLGQARKWQESYGAEHPLRISVNLSTRQLREDRELVKRVGQALERTGVEPSSLQLEVTESLLLEDADAGARLFGELRERGVRVCMDDFGTGYSSLSYLHRARVDMLKIDLSFVRNLTADNEHSEIVRTILTLTKALGLASIAEGVETDAQLARLRELGCDAAQGYLFSPAVDAETAEVLLKSHPHW